MKNKINVGDYIVCLDKPNSNPFIKNASNDADRGGCGFINNMCFKVRDVIETNNNNIYFFENHLHGVYNNSVRLATYEEIEYYNQINEPYDITKVNLKPVKSNITTLINILKYIQNHEIIFAAQKQANS
jgi:hypothetical protein